MRNVGMKTGLTVALTILVCLALLLGLNTLTAPLIAANSSAQQFGLLFDAMPDAAGFEPLYNSADSAVPALTVASDTVKAVYREINGSGYALRLSTSQGYTKEPMEFTLAVSAEGRIIGAVLTAYPETKDMGQDSYPQSFVGQDSTLADVGLVAGVTYSSSAFRNAVSDGLAVLIDNGLITAGQKSDAQLLTELAATVYPGLVNGAGVAQAEELEVTGTFIQSGMRALNGSGCAFILRDADGAGYLGLCNTSGSCRLYDVEGRVAEGKTELEQEITAAAAQQLEPLSDKDAARLKTLAGDGAELTPLPLPGVFSTVTNAFTVTGGDGTTRLGFIAKSYGYTNLVMTVYYILDENGAIAAMTADELIFFGEYFTDYTLDEEQYKAGFAGLTADSWSGEQAVIAGATASSNGVAQATRDVFEAFAIVTGGKSE